MFDFHHEACANSTKSTCHSFGVQGHANTRARIYGVNRQFPLEMNVNTKAKFTGGRNIAMKVPPHLWDATVQFYWDIAGLCAIAMMLLIAMSAVAQNKDAKGSYASVNGLEMYYEIHGSGQPLVLLHGAFGFVEGWATVLPTLTKTHQVIAVELQGHGHTNDLERPLIYEQMAEDVAALLQQLQIKDADLFGYSMGGMVALGVAIRHPELVRKLAT